MKATRLIMMFVAATAMMLASCEKDNENTTDLENNTVVYNGVTYHMNNMVSYANEDLTFFMSMSTETTDDENPRMVFGEIHIYPEMWGKTYNLSVLEEIQGLRFFDGPDLFCSTTYNGNGYDGSIDDVDYPDESPFTKGTFSIRGNNDGSPVTVTLDGTLRNGKTIQMKLVTNSYSTQN